MAEDRFPGWHGTTILAVRRGGKVVVAGDGQVSVGPTVIKGTARKVRRLSPGGHDVVVGFAGSTADAFTLLERLEKEAGSGAGAIGAGLRRSGQGLAHGQVSAQPGGHADRDRRRALLWSPAPATCWSRSMTWRPSARAGISRWRRRAG
jgi:hypothetical protein